MHWWECYHNNMSLLCSCDVTALVLPPDRVLPAEPPWDPWPKLFFPELGAGSPDQHGPGRAKLLPRGPSIPAGQSASGTAGRATEWPQVPGIQRPEGAGLLPDVSWEVWRRLPGLPRSDLNLMVTIWVLNKPETLLTQLLLQVTLSVSTPTSLSSVSLWTNPSVCWTSSPWLVWGPTWRRLSCCARRGMVEMALRTLRCSGVGWFKRVTEKRGVWTSWEPQTEVRVCKSQGHNLIFEFGICFSIELILDWVSVTMDPNHEAFYGVKVSSYTSVTRRILNSINWNQYQNQKILLEHLM